MDRANEIPKTPTADQVAELADKGEDISRFFTKAGSMMPPLNTANAEPELVPSKDIRGDKF